MNPKPSSQSRDLTLPTTRAKQAAMRAEQQVVERIHDRVDALRVKAEQRVHETNRERGGSTFQAQYERDVTAFHHAARAHEFTVGDVEALAFGRIDATDGDTMYIGRRGVIDETGDALLVDWRAPVSEAFYQATAHDPRGLARRRTLVCHGRTVTDLDDEILDADAAAQLNIEPVNGDGALVAAMSRERTHQMRDIVATIQAEQDRIIRAPANGTLIVTGGPGTGKTVVALHRVASLLYRDRSRYAARGVLVVGPSHAFTAYTSRVLPALGETAVVQRPLAQLAPRGVQVEGWADPKVAALTGSTRMVAFARRVVAGALPAIPPETRFSVLGTSATLTAAKVERLRTQHFDSLNTEDLTYHQRSRAATDALFQALFAAWRRQRQGAGFTVTDTEKNEFFALIGEMPQVRMLLRCFWPALDVVAVLHSLFDRQTDYAVLCHGLFDDKDMHDLRDHFVTGQRFAVDDVGLVDEVAALVGPPATVTRNDEDQVNLPPREDTLEPDGVGFHSALYRDFAHVVVDEAQDLTPMQWRAVARRGPYATWTVVGDLAQRSREVKEATWHDVAKLIGRRQVEIHTLSVNYRTPKEIAAVARQIVAATDPTHAQNLPEAVRATGEQPRLIHTDDVLDSVRQEMGRLLDARDGTLALITTASDRDRFAAALTEADAQRVRILDARTAKGLEFDEVIIVEPERLLKAPLGHALLYVAATRPTRSLTFVSTQPNPIAGASHCVYERHSRQA